LSYKNINSNRTFFTTQFPVGPVAETVPAYCDDKGEFINFNLGIGWGTTKNEHQKQKGIARKIYVKEHILL
jgi:hypothetical protein